MIIIFVVPQWFFPQASFMAFSASILFGHGTINCLLKKDLVVVDSWVLPSGKALGLVSRRTLVQFCLGFLLPSKVVVCGHCPMVTKLTLSHHNEWNCKMTYMAAHLLIMQSHSPGDSVALGIASLLLHLLGSPSLPVPLLRKLDIKVNISVYNQPRDLVLTTVAVFSVVLLRYCIHF